MKVLIAAALVLLAGVEVARLATGWWVGKAIGEAIGQQITGSLAAEAGAIRLGCFVVSGGQVVNVEVACIWVLERWQAAQEHGV